MELVQQLLVVPAGIQPQHPRQLIHRLNLLCQVILAARHNGGQHPAEHTKVHVLRATQNHSAYLNFLPVEQHTCRCAAHGFAKHQVDGTILFFFDILFQLFGHCFRRGKVSFAGIIIAVRADGDHMVLLFQQRNHRFKLAPAHHVAGQQHNFAAALFAKFLYFHINVPSSDPCVIFD